MKIMNCPLNGPRNISEFVCLGEYKRVPPPDAGAAAWAEYVFFEDNIAGIVREYWMHIASNYVFVVERDTLTEEIIKTMPLESAMETARSSHSDHGGKPHE